MSLGWRRKWRGPCRVCRAGGRCQINQRRGAEKWDRGWWEKRGSSVGQPSLFEASEILLSYIFGHPENNRKGLSESTGVKLCRIRKWSDGKILRMERWRDFFHNSRIWLVLGEEIVNKVAPSGRNCVGKAGKRLPIETVSRCWSSYLTWVKMHRAHAAAAAASAGVDNKINVGLCHVSETHHPAFCCVRPLTVQAPSQRRNICSQQQVSSRGKRLIVSIDYRNWKPTLRNYVNGTHWPAVCLWFKWHYINGIIPLSVWICAFICDANSTWRPKSEFSRSECSSAADEGKGWNPKWKPKFWKAKGRLWNTHPKHSVAEAPRRWEEAK